MVKSEYDEDFLKIKFDTDEDLPLNKAITVAPVDNNC